MRDIGKAISEYKKKFYGKKSTKGKFYSSDFYQINEISKGEKWECIYNASMAGFMIGYKLAKREEKERRK